MTKISADQLCRLLTLIEHHARNAREQVVISDACAAAAAQPRLELAGAGVAGRIGNGQPLPPSPQQAMAQQAQALRAAANVNLAQLRQWCAALDNTLSGKDADHGQATRGE